MNPLQIQLAALRRRLRLIVSVRGFCWLATLVLLTATVEGWLDWRVHLPSLVRLIVLVGGLSGAVYVAYRYLVEPLATPSDDLTLALKIESQYPIVRDSLASTVQFLEQFEKMEGSGSLSLRRAAVQRTLTQIQGFDFHNIINTRGIGTAGLCVVISAALTIALTGSNPMLAWTALQRLAVPFGNLDWPHQTQFVNLTAPDRLARGEPFEVRGQLRGLIPEYATITFEGISPSHLSYLLQRESDHQSGNLNARLERVERSFRFQVQANDAVSDWYSVVVQPPPVLVPLNGRPSPQVRLRYPDYTDLAIQDLPDGSGNIEAIVGTLVTLRAATDRPVAKAWIEYRAEQPLVSLAGYLGVLGPRDVLSVLGSSAGSEAVAARIPIQIEANGRELRVQFLPRVRGMYALHFEDEAGFGNTRLFDLRLLNDPAPLVNLERPSPNHESLQILPGAEITVQIAAEDSLFAVRSAKLAYRCRNSAGDPEPEALISLYDHSAVAQVAAPLLSGFARHPLVISGPEPRLRPQRLQISRRFSLNQFKHANGRSLQEGDSVILQACADDFDDVAVDKAAGRSHEVELMIISKSTLEALLDRSQTQVQEELLRLRKEQQEALQHVIGAEQRWRNTGKLRSQDIDQVLQAEQLQQQIRSRIGTRREGLRAEVERILQASRDNKLSRSGTQDRMEAIETELERLAREDLEQIEPRLTNARKENETTASPQPPAKDQKGSLGEARQHQEEVERTLNELLKLLEPWGNLSAVKGEAKAILQDQRKLAADVQKLDTESQRGQSRDALPAEQRGALDRAAELQRKLEDRVDQLLGKMGRASEERRAKEPEMADALKEAMDKGQQGAVRENLRNAREKLRENKLSEASANQRAGAKAMEGMVQALEERRTQELDRLRKKLKETEDKLDDLIRQQEELRKKSQEAQQLSDPQQRDKRLKELAREQEQVRKETQEMVRELTRQRADQAGQALSGASNSMDQVGRQLEQGQNSDNMQEETLDRLKEAQRRVNQVQDRVDEELAREKLAKIADQLKLLKERQDSAIAETERIADTVLQRRGWDRRTRTNLGDLADAQVALARETEDVAKKKLDGVKVFARVLARAAEAMTEASERMRQQLKQLLDQPESSTIDEDIRRQQRVAIVRLDQLLDALKTEAGGNQGGGDSGSRQGGSGEGGSGEGSADQAGERRPMDSVPPMGQLKVLRALQQEVNERTSTFAIKNPNLDKLTKKQQLELLSIRKDQQEIADLLDELTATTAPEGEKK